MGNKKGFTLLELMIVVVIIGILASIALPTYTKVKERARKAEALVTLSATRQSQIRYYSENDKYATSLPSLDFDPTAGGPGIEHFTYTMTSDGSTFTVTAIRNLADNPGGVTGTVTIDDDGTIGGTGVYIP